MIFNSKPRIDEINLETSETQKAILRELTSIDEFLAKYDFTLYSRKLAHFQVEVKYKRNNDIIIVYFYSFPLDYPDWFALVVLSNKNGLRRKFVSLKGLRKPDKLNKDQLEYRLIEPGALKIEKKNLQSAVNEILNDFTNHAQDYLKGDYNKLQEEYSVNKKYYNKQYRSLFY